MVIIVVVGDTVGGHPVVVDTDSAAALVTLVLLDHGRGPAAEGFEVAETLAVVVVGVPKGQALVGGRVPAQSDNILPVVVTCVNASRDTKAVSLVDHGIDKGLVGGVAAGPVVGLHIVPVHVRLGSVALQEIDSVADLLCGVSTADAGEDVGAHVLNTGRSSSLDGSGGVRVGASIRFVGAD